MSDSLGKDSKHPSPQKLHQVDHPASQSNLMPCVDCGNECSRLAESCPHCGRFFQKIEPDALVDRTDQWLIRIFGILLTMVLLLLILSVLIESDMVSCLITLIFCCIFALGLILILRASNPGAVGIKEYAELARIKFNEAENHQERVGAILYASFIVFRGGYITLAVPIAVAAFTTLAAICRGWGVEELKMLRLLLQDFYAFVEHLMKG